MYDFDELRNLSLDEKAELFDRILDEIYFEYCTISGTHLAHNSKYFCTFQFAGRG